MEDRDFKDIQKELVSLLTRTKDLYKSLDIESLKTRAKILEGETQKEDFWQNKEKFAETNQEISKLKKKIDPWDRLISDLSESIELIDMASSENDIDLLNEIGGKLGEFMKRFDDIETLELLSGEDDSRNSFITIHPGAGGTESQDWASMLFRMYYRWAEKKGYSIEVIDYSPGEEAGIKTATMLIKGDYCYGMLKGEKGVHRLVRISPFDTNKRRHTSFASLEVIPEVEEDIDLEIKETEIRIDTYRSSGAGGQHVNKTDSAVRITHIPTGIVVQCQNERSQHKNKAFALKVLKSRLYQMRRKEQEEKQLEKLGQKKDISWGNQIRSYVFQPYTLVKDHRTSEEIGNIEAVFDGGIDRFIYAYLKSITVKG